MLRDFYMLEDLFGADSAGVYLDEVLEHYAEEELRMAFETGYLQGRVICIGPDCGRVLCWLSHDGRDYVDHLMSGGIQTKLH